MSFLGRKRLSQEAQWFPDSFVPLKLGYLLQITFLKKILRNFRFCNEYDQMQMALDIKVFDMNINFFNIANSLPSL